MAGLLEEFAAVWTRVWLDAIVAQDVRNQIVLGSVRLLTHAALPALQALADVHAVGLIDLDVDIQSVDAAAAGCLSFYWLCPEHPLAVLIEVSDTFHLGTFIGDFAWLKVAANFLAAASCFYHAISPIVPVIGYLIYSFFMCVAPVA